MTLHYLNLTNGIEALAVHGIPFADARFIRIQSSHCETHRWIQLLDTLDNDFLLHLALGCECIVYDGYCRGKKGSPRALWQGLALVRYVVERCWYGRHIYFPSGMSNYFSGVYETLPKRVLRRIEYFKRYTEPDGLVNLSYRAWRSSYDGDYTEHAAQIKEAAADATH